MGTTKRRGIGITRVSFEGDRTEDRLYSYDTQRDAIMADCDGKGVHLLRVAKERAVSGGASLSNRPEFLGAVEAVERGEADTIIVAYFDRFFRNLKVQTEVIERIEKAGGELFALDHGRLTNGTAAEKLYTNVMGSISQFYREQIGEKSAIGQAAAVAGGKVPWSRTALGFVRTDGGYEPDPATVPIVNECFQMRLAGASYMTIRGWLRDVHGIERSPRGVDVLLRNRAYLGEVRFGDLVNLNAHEPIVDVDVFNRVQRMKIPRGPQPKSTRLLSRLKVLRCGSCGSTLGTMKLPKQGDYPIYRCNGNNDCERHVTISAQIVEAWTWEQVKEHLADGKGRASADEDAARVVRERDAAQEALDRAVRSFGAAGLQDEPSAVDTLTGLRATRDAKQEAVDTLPSTTAFDIAPVDDDVPLDVRRDLLRAIVRTITVAPSGPGLARGAGRLSIEFVG